RLRQGDGRLGVLLARGVADRHEDPQPRRRRRREPLRWQLRGVPFGGGSQVRLRVRARPRLRAAARRRRRDPRHPALRPTARELAAPVRFEDVTTQREKIERFAALHRGERPLLMPNPWDAGSAKVLASLGFEALATTSSGFAATLGRTDGDVTRDEALAHGAVIADATDVPVSADLENGFADDPEGVAATIRLAAASSLAGASVEDWSGPASKQLYD